VLNFSMYLQLACSSSLWRELRLIDLMDGRSNGLDTPKDINISIPPSKHVTICGRSGSGRFTLISILLRLFEPSKGSVIARSQSISQFTQQPVCKRVTIMPQDTCFNPRGCGDSVRENLDPLGKVDDDAKIYDNLYWTRQV
jgi:ABC-type multidrug transport system fused ATPase/permease subunit